MEITVSTGMTKSNGSITLLPLVLEGVGKEQVCALFQIHSHPRDAKILEDEVLGILQHALLDSEGESWHRLDGTLKELNGLFKGFIASESVSDIHAVISFIDKQGALHVSHAGRGEAYVVRGGAASQITEFMKGKPMPMFVHISSGELEAGDTVILATQRLLRSFTPAQLSQAAQREGDLIEEIAAKLESEREIAALARIHVIPPRVRAAAEPEAQPERVTTTSARRPARRGSSSFDGRAMLSMLTDGATLLTKKVSSMIPERKAGARSSGAKFTLRTEGLSKAFATFLADLRHPERKKRAHLLLIAGAIAVFLLFWVIVQLTSVSQQGKTKTQLQQLLTQVEEELKTADNKRLMGDTDSANAILTHAEDQAKQVINNESGLFRSEALNLLDRVHSKQEEISNVVRVSPRLLVNIAAKDDKVTAQGLIGIADGEFIAYDRQSVYHILLNSVEDGKKVTEDDSIIRGTAFGRYKSEVFLTTGNSVIEVTNGQPTVMKTDDTNGWVAGRDVEAYLRYLYVLGTDDKIYKYERISNRYGPSVQYNVNGDLTHSLDIAIDGNVFVLKEKGQVVKLFRGEVQPFSIKHAPTNILADCTHLFKLPSGNFYFLDPVGKRVIVTSDGGATGDSNYVKQYVLEGDQLGKLQDLYVDSDETHLYVMDEQRVYIIDLRK